MFIVAGAEAYRRDLPAAEVHVLEGGHFLLEQQHRAGAGLIESFLAAHQTE